MIEFAAGFCLLAAIVFAALWRRARSDGLEAVRGRDAAEVSRAAMAAVLGTVPVAGFRWRRDDPEPLSLSRLPGAAETASYRDFVAALDPADAERVGAAIGELRGSGTRFTAAVSIPGGAAYQIDGTRTAAGDAVLWVSDASAVHRAEAERAAASALRAALNALPVAIWRRGADFRLLDCNEAYARALDLPRETAITDNAALAPDGGAVAGSGRSERRHVVIGGSRRLLDITEIPDPVSGGTIGFAFDRTDLESAEGELARHVNAHGQVLESIRAAVAIYGADKRLHFYNSAFVDLWGIEEDLLSGEPSLDELLERLRERRRVPEFVDFRAFKRQQLAMFTSLIEPQHELMHLPDGRILGVAVSPHPLGGLIFVYEDVTDRLALEGSYNTLIEVQRETLDNLFEGIAVFGSDGRLKLHNPAYRQIWALAEGDLAGEPHFSDIVDKTRSFYDDSGDWPAARAQVVARITNQAHWSWQLDRSDGSVLQLATVPLPDGNILFTCLDITDRTRVERALRERNQALETTDRLKSEFIANVSYELRTPLNAIIGFAEILANQYFGPLTARQADYSRGILDSSHRLMALINDILDLATIEAGYLALETEPVDVREMLDAVAALIRERARSQNLSLTVDCPADIGAIDADERRLKQALLNLISNAIKFTPAGGTIRLDAGLDGGDLTLAVSDTGVGIPSADQERIFEKFERANPQSRESGAGLGLSLVKSLIELHGGSVTIESQPGAGTTIRCRLPASLRLASTPAAAHPAA